MRKRTLTFGIALLLALAILAGCAGDTATSSAAPAATSAAPVSASTAAPAQVLEPDGFTYPMQDVTETVTWWLPLNSNVSAGSPELNSAPFAAYLQEATGVTIDFQHPVAGSEREGFNLIIAGGDLPDIMEDVRTYYSAGLADAEDLGYIISLNDHMDEWAPNYAQLMSDHSDWANMAVDDEGRFLQFNFIRGDERLRTYAGLVVRQDWLDTLGMEVPTTIDEWTTMLCAFRDEMGATNPLITRGSDRPDAFTNAVFSGAFGVQAGLFQTDGIVYYGEMQDGYRQTLELFQGWYAEGLFNKDFATDDGTMKNTKILNGDGGAFYGLLASGMGVITNSARSAGDEELLLVGAPYPTVNKGGTPEFGQKDLPIPGGGASITGDCKNLEVCFRLLDYAYTEEGWKLYNFGSEGISYTIEDGVYTYTDLIKNNPDGMSISNANGQHSRSSYGGPFVQSEYYLDQTLALPEQIEACATWTQTNQDAHSLPPMTISADLGAEYSAIKADIDTFVYEYTSLAISGDKDLSKFETEFVDELKKMNVERMIEIYQDALDAYYAARR